MGRFLKAITPVCGPWSDPGAKNKRDCNKQFPHTCCVWWNGMGVHKRVTHPPVFYVYA